MGSHRKTPLATLALLSAAIVAPGCASAPGPSHARGHTVIADDRAEAIATARAEDKLLLYSFTGFNCASCRGMEANVFRDPAVAATMKTHFVESRHHVDTQNTLTDAQFTANRKLQADLAGTMAMPYFVVVDPGSGETISEHELSGGPGEWTERWREYLGETLRRAGR